MTDQATITTRSRNLGYAWHTVYAHGEPKYTLGRPGIVGTVRTVRRAMAARQREIGRLSRYYDRFFVGGVPVVLTEPGELRDILDAVELFGSAEVTLDGTSEWTELRPDRRTR